MGAYLGKRFAFFIHLGRSYNSTGGLEVGEQVRRGGFILHICLTIKEIYWKQEQQRAMDTDLDMRYDRKSS